MPQSSHDTPSTKPCGASSADAQRRPDQGANGTRTLGQRLRELRTRHGLSQRELAKRAQVTNSTISQVEQDAVSPSVSSLHKILEVFPVSLSDFFSDEIPAAPHRILRREDHENVESDGTKMTLQQLPCWLAGSGQTGRDIGAPAQEIQLGHMRKGASASLQAKHDSVVVISRGILRITLNTAGTEALDVMLRPGDAVRLHAGERYRLHQADDVPGADAVTSREDLSETAHWITISPAR